MTKIQNFTGIDVSKKSFDVSYREKGKVRTKKFTYTAGRHGILSGVPSVRDAVYPGIYRYVSSAPGYVPA
jgi:hypothetical protein